MNWISVEDKLPDTTREVLALDRKNEMFVGQYLCGRDVWVDSWVVNVEILSDCGCSGIGTVKQPIEFWAELEEIPYPKFEVEAAEKPE